MKEKLTQLSLTGFGQETGLQQTNPELKTIEPVAQEQLFDLEAGRELLVVPAKTTFYRYYQPDRGFTALKPFYVSQRAGFQAGGRDYVNVRVEETGVQVYHDQQYFILEKGEILEAPRRRLIKKSK